MISVGKKVNTISGLTDAITNSVFRFMNNDPTSMNAALTAQEYGVVGQYIGEFIKAFLETQTN